MDGRFFGRFVNGIRVEFGSNQRAVFSRHRSISGLESTQLEAAIAPNLPSRRSGFFLVLALEYNKTLGHGVAVGIRDGSARRVKLGAAPDCAKQEQAGKHPR